AGADASNNFYLSSFVTSGLLKYDPNGNLLAVTAWPVSYPCPGCPSPSFINQMNQPTAMAFDPLTSDLYVSDNAASLLMGRSVLRYSNQQFSARLSMPSGEFASDIAIGIARELYVADTPSKQVHVFDLAGN